MLAVWMKLRSALLGFRLTIEGLLLALRLKLLSFDIGVAASGKGSSPLKRLISSRDVVYPAGFEPVTYTFGGQRSAGDTHREAICE
jgi:hypothetical protein